MLAITRAYGHSYVPNLIEDDSVVLDVGANRGKFAFEILGKHRCAVVAFEPVPQLATAIPRHPRLKVNAVALGRSPGTVSLYAHHGESSTTVEYLAPSESSRVDVPVETLEDHLNSWGQSRIALLKLDAEGAEHEILGSLSEASLRRIDQVTVEFHDFLHESEVEKRKATSALLEAAGFLRLDLSPRGLDTLFINNQALRISHLTRTRLLLSYKYARGAVRRAKRVMGVDSV